MGSNANNLYTSTGVPAAGSFGVSSLLRAEFDRIEAGLNKVRAKEVFGYFADLNTAGSIYLPAPGLGEVTALKAVLGANNASAITTLTAAIGTPGSFTAITHDTWDFAADALAGAYDAVEPSAENVITAASQVIRITTDGGGSGTVPAIIMVEVELT